MFKQILSGAPAQRQPGTNVGIITRATIFSTWQKLNEYQIHHKQLFDGVKEKIKDTLQTHTELEYTYNLN